MSAWSLEFVLVQMDGLLVPFRTRVQKQSRRERNEMRLRDKQKAGRKHCRNGFGLFIISKARQAVTSNLGGKNEAPAHGTLQGSCGEAVMLVRGVLWSAVML